jgi:CTP:molybdopterin cytidylyltransferase MocA
MLAVHANDSRPEPGTGGPMGTAELQVIVLAAGPSTRFGTPGQLARVADAPMLRLVLSRALALAGQSVVVVLGAHAGDMATALGRAPVTVVLDRLWSEGLSSSIRAAIERVPGSCAGALLLPADQVAVTTADLQRLADAWRRNRQSIVAAQHAGGYALPAIFPRSQFPALRALRGDDGPQALLRSGAGRLLSVPMASAALDFNTPDDLPARDEAAGAAESAS